MSTLKNNYQHRFAMIQDELKALKEFIHSSSELQSKFGEPSSYSDMALTHLNNIEIACNLEDSECLRWKPYTSKKNKYEVEITRTAYQGKVLTIEAETKEGAIYIALQKAFMEDFEDYSHSEYKIISSEEINN